MVMRWMHARWVALALSLLISLPAAAERDWLTGLYVGAGVGWSQMEPDLSNTGYSMEDDDDIGWKVFGGIDITEQLSAELYYANLDEVRLNPNGAISYVDYGASALYYFWKQSEYREGLSAFAHAGLGQWKLDGTVPYEESQDRHLMLGAGFEYYLEDGYSLRLETELYSKDGRMTSLNLVKRFGGKKRKVVEEPVVVVPPPAPEPEPEPEPVKLDSDHDGVFDEDDKCPDTAEGTKVDETGCKLMEVIVLKGVVFANNSAELIGDSAANLDAVATTILRYPGLKIEVAGYTDSRGSNAYNVKLSQRRADAVRSYLIDQGVPAEQLTAKGYGPENPIADNGTAEGRALNRRVELHIVDQDPNAAVTVRQAKPVAAAADEGAGEEAAPQSAPQGEAPVEGAAEAAPVDGGTEPATEPAAVEEGTAEVTAELAVGTEPAAEPSGSAGVMQLDAPYVE